MISTENWNFWKSYCQVKIQDYKLNTILFWQVITELINTMQILATIPHTCYYILQWNLNIEHIWQIICFETMLVIKAESSI